MCHGRRRVIADVSAEGRRRRPNGSGDRHGPKRGRDWPGEHQDQPGHRGQCHPGEHPGTHHLRLARRRRHADDERGHLDGRTDVRVHLAAVRPGGRDLRRHERPGPDVRCPRRGPRPHDPRAGAGKKPARLRDGPIRSDGGRASRERGWGGPGRTGDKRLAAGPAGDHRLLVLAERVPKPDRSSDAPHSRQRHAGTSSPGRPRAGLGGTLRPCDGCSETTANSSGVASIVVRPTARLPLQRGASVVFFLRARKPGDNVLAGVSTRRLVQVRVIPG